MHEFSNINFLLTLIYFLTTLFQCFKNMKHFHSQAMNNSWSIYVQADPNLQSNNKYKPNFGFDYYLVTVLLQKLGSMFDQLRFVKCWKSPMTSWLLKSLNSQRNFIVKIFQCYLLFFWVQNVLFNIKIIPYTWFARKLFIHPLRSCLLNQLIN